MVPIKAHNALLRKSTDTMVGSAVASIIGSGHTVFHSTQCVSYNTTLLECSSTVSNIGIAQLIAERFAELHSSKWYATSLLCHRLR